MALIPPGTGIRNKGHFGSQSSTPALDRNSHSTDMPDRKPRVVSLGAPRYVGDDYLAEFAREFDYSALDAYDRRTTKELLPLDIQKNGPVDAFIIRMGTLPYEPFDADLLSALVPGCKIITSASAGYNEFDVDWMAKHGVWFCNTVDAVAEATADMAIFLALAALRNTTNAEKSARTGTWRSAAGLVPAKDPSGLTLGIIGLGAIGKVSVIPSPVTKRTVANGTNSTLPGKPPCST